MFAAASIAAFIAYCVAIRNGMRHSPVLIALLVIYTLVLLLFAWYGMMIHDGEIPQPGG